MTRCEFFTEDERITGFTVSGHSGYAEAGSDIVCAAVSALTQGAVIGLKEVIGLEIALDISDGYMYCMLPKKISAAQQHDAELILNTMAASIASLAETNGDYIKLTDREV